MATVGCATHLANSGGACCCPFHTTPVLPLPLPSQKKNSCSSTAACPAKGKINKQNTAGRALLCRKGGALLVMETPCTKHSRPSEIIMAHCAVGVVFCCLFVCIFPLSFFCCCFASNQFGTRRLTHTHACLHRRSRSHSTCGLVKEKKSVSMHTRALSRACARVLVFVCVCGNGGVR